MNCYEEYDKDGKLILCKDINGDEYKFNSKGKIIYYKNHSTGDEERYLYDENKLIERSVNNYERIISYHYKDRLHEKWYENYNYDKDGVYREYGIGFTVFPFIPYKKIK